MAAGALAASSAVGHRGDGYDGGDGGGGHDDGRDDGGSSGVYGRYGSASPPLSLPAGIAISHPTVDAFASAVVTYRPGAPAAAVATRPLLWGLTLNALLRLVAVAGGGVAGGSGGGRCSTGDGGGVEQVGAPLGGRLFAGHALVPPVAVDHPVVAAFLWRLPRGVGEWVLGLR